MLANPIFLGEWDNTLGITAVVLALVVECAVISRLLRGEVRAPGRPVLLALINAVSWPCFFALLPRAWYVVPPEGLALLLEVPVVFFEASVIWMVGRTRLGSVLVANPTLSIRRALGVVTLGNLASVLAGYLFLALILKPGGFAIALALTAGVLFALSEFVQILAAMPPARRRPPQRRSGTQGR